MDEAPRAEEEEAVFTATDLRNLAGLTYRQVNDWDSRGALPHGRSKETGWRRFSPREVFSLMIASAFKNAVGVPVERLKWLVGYMGQEEADHLKAAVEIMGSSGAAVWLLTDFEQVFIMDSEFEILDLWRAGMFHTEDDRIYGLLNIGPLVNRLLSMIDGDPIAPIRIGGENYESLRTEFARTPEESLLMNLLRSGDFDKVEVTAAAGQIEVIRPTRRVDATTRIGDLLRDADFQTISVTTRSGRVVSITQELVVKPVRRKRP